MDKKYIFIHIPKNAGTSVYTALGMKEASHSTSKQIKNELGAKQFNALYKFAFVRNPFARFLSLYNYARMEESFHHSNIDPNKAKWGQHADYDLLKNATLKECAQYLLEGKLTHNAPNIQWFPQHFWLLDDNGKLLVDFIGRTEYSATDFGLICRRLDLKQDLPDLNKSSNVQDYRQFFDEETKEMVTEYYKKDLELFGYKF